MKKESEKTVAVMRKKSGAVDAFIYSVIPLLVVTYLLLCFWNYVGGDRLYAAYMRPVSNVPILISEILRYDFSILSSIVGLLGLNLLVYYVIFRAVGKVVACPWCCVAICLQVIAVGYCLVSVA